MARRRWFAIDDVASMGWCWCLIILVIGACRGLLAADSAAMEPNAAVPRAEEGGCYRPLSDVIWGFLVTLLALTLFLWGSVKHRGDDTATACINILLGVFTPLVDLVRIVQCSLRCVSLLWNSHKMGSPKPHFMSCSWLKFLFSSLLPWSKSPARILAFCNIVVYVSKESPLLQKKWSWSSDCVVKDESEAMVVGDNGARAIRNGHYEREELSLEGIGMLVWKEVFFKVQDCKRLPKYDELKYLGGNSGFAVIAIAVQAFGYIYAVGFRNAKNLRISPLEVIGLVFNIILLMKVFFYRTCNPCHRPLVIYMDKEWEHDFGQFDDNDYKKFERYDLRKIQGIIGLGIFVGVIALLIYCIVNIAKSTNVMVVIPIIAFLLRLCFNYLRCQIIEVDLNNNHVSQVYILTIAFLVNAVAYIWAIVGTMLYWRAMHFNARGDLINLSQDHPFYWIAHGPLGDVSCVIDGFVSIKLSLWF